MKIPNPFSRRPTEELRVPVPTFVGEKDGPPERLFKAKLSELFAGRKNLLRAYLARVHYGDPKAVSVCLCLAVTGRDDKEVVEAMHSMFAQQFNRAVHLDIVFLEPKQENELCRVQFVLSTQLNYSAHLHRKMPSAPGLSANRKGGS